MSRSHILASVMCNHIFSGGIFSRRVFVTCLLVSPVVSYHTYWRASKIFVSFNLSEHFCIFFYLAIKFVWPITRLTAYHQQDKFWSALYINQFYPDHCPVSYSNIWRILLRVEIEDIFERARNDPHYLIWTLYLLGAFRILVVQGLN